MSAGDLFAYQVADQPAEQSTVKKILGKIVLIAGVVYEAASKIIPTKKIWSIVGNALNWLARIYNALDNKSD